MDSLSNKGQENISKTGNDDRVSPRDIDIKFSEKDNPQEPDVDI